MSRNRSPFRNHIEFLLYRAARLSAQGIGPSALNHLGSTLGNIFFKLSRRRNRILAFNLKLAFPEKSSTERKALGQAVAQHFGRVFFEALRVQTLSPEQFRREVHVKGHEHLETALARNRGLIFLSAHIGSWEVAALETGLRLKTGLAVINRPLDNALLETELQRLRSIFGNRTLGRSSIARSVLRELASHGGVGILIDQRSLRSEGVDVPFFGHLACTHTILGHFVRKTRAPVVPLWAFWDGPASYTVRYDPPVFADDLPPEDLDDYALTERFTKITEDVIRERPEQWLWYHDRWRDLRIQSLNQNNS